MIESIEFHNFKALRDTTLALGQLTLIVGPNGSGKSTALQAIECCAAPGDFRHSELASFGSTGDAVCFINWIDPQARTETRWLGEPQPNVIQKLAPGLSAAQRDRLARFLSDSRVYALDPLAIASPVMLRQTAELQQNGQGLAAVLDRLRDHHPERFESLNLELGRWLPEFDRILFEVPGDGERSFLLRTTNGHQIRSIDLSHGSLLAVAILTIAWLPEPPPLVAFEDPDRGMHPRLLVDVRDALYRLAYPQDCGEDRQPVQVVATTHSPYLLDLFRDHPQEIVIAEKNGTEAAFHRLVDRADIEEILGDASLGDVWYSGVLGGVPAG